MSSSTLLIRMAILSALSCAALLSTGCKRYVPCSEGWVAAPDKLVADYEYLALGGLVSVDTLLDLGSVDQRGHVTGGSVVEYAFQIEEILKGKDGNVSMIYLWYGVTRNLRSGFDDGLYGASSQPVLVYGNVIDGPENIALLYAAQLGDIYGNVDEIPLEDFSAHDFVNREVDSTFLSRIMVSDELPSILNKRRATGIVVYVHSLIELESYYRDKLMYPNDLCGCWEVPAEKYLQEVREILKRPGT